MDTEFFFYIVELTRLMVTLYHSESQNGNAPNIDCTERLVACSIWKNSTR